jgi:hypothetical protein
LGLDEKSIKVLSCLPNSVLLVSHGCLCDGLVRVQVEGRVELGADDLLLDAAEVDRLHLGAAAE